MMSVFARAVLSVLVVATMAPGVAPAAEHTSVLFILDASGSMWGRIDGTEKITVAKGTLIQLVGELGDDTAIGLMAYGHRREGDCDDIEFLVPIGAGQREALESRVQALNPRGKTPIIRSLRRASETIGEASGDVAVVLLSDGIENCDDDPCGGVTALIESGVPLRLFVVGFGVGDDEAAQLACLAEAGNGTYATAASAEELLQALVRVAEQLGEPEEDVAGTLIVTASGSSQYTVYDAAAEQRVDSARTNTEMSLAPGFYVVQLGRSRQLVQIRAGEETRLGAGSVVVNGLGEGLYSVFDVTGEHKVDFTRTNRPIDVLEGAYMVTLSNTRRVVTVVAGETTEVVAASLAVTGESGALYGIHDPTGETKYEFTRVGKAIEVLPGFYSVRVGDRWIRDIELVDGQRLEIPEAP
jgi:hypothetical protein